jgi:hypothetical protein
MINRKNVKEVCCDIMLRYYPRICLEGLMKHTKNLSQDRRSPN